MKSKPRAAKEQHLKMNPVVTTIVTALVSSALTGVIGWSFSTSVASFEKSVESTKRVVEDHEKRIREIESGSQLHEVQQTLQEIRERVARIETRLDTQLAPDKHR